MPVAAPIIEVQRDGSSTPLGEHEFLIWPSPGDIIAMIGPGAMSFQFMRVLYVEHSPVALPRSIVTEDEQPRAAVYVEFAWREDTGAKMPR